MTTAGAELAPPGGRIIQVPVKCVQGAVGVPCDTMCQLLELSVRSDSDACILGVSLSSDEQVIGLSDKRQ